MRTYDATTLAALAGDTAFEARRFIWITGKDRDTGDPESLGIWEGEDDIVVTIGGFDRTYVGGGGLLDIEPIRAAVGTDVRLQQVTLSPIDETVAAAIRLYDARLAPVEIHRGLFNPLSGVILAEPHRMFRGWVNEASITEGRNATVVLSIASAMRTLTRSLPLTRSDAEMRRRDADDRFREYGDISGEVPVWWGEARFNAAPAAPPPPAVFNPSPNR
jgi:hypothetical protein